MKILEVLLSVLMTVSLSLGQVSSRAVQMNPAEIEEIVPSVAGAGTSGLTGIRTRILADDPNRTGLYTIQLTIPVNTTIQAHVHPDERVATVISGIWYIGFGYAFDEKKLKALRPGSFYTEPSDELHFARTGKRPVVVQITGYGPTGTEYRVKSK